MGIQDRDYYRAGSDRRSFGGAVHPWSVTTWLIVVNVAVFVLNLVLVTPGRAGQVLAGHDPFGNPVFATVRLPPTHPIEQWGYFSVDTAVLHGQAWRFLTFQFLHASLEHVAFNMIGLFFFGPLIEQYLGRRRYLAFYLLCGTAGPVAYMLLWAMHLLAAGPATPLVGASAGIFGVLIAAATVAPDEQVLIYGIVPVRLRTFAWGLLAIAVFVIFSRGQNAGGQAAHLGGAGVGAWLIRHPGRLNWANGLGRRRPRFRYRP